MTKADLIDAIAFDAEMPKCDAESALSSIMRSITFALERGEDVTLVGFGTFSVKTRQARTGRNPQTGEAIEIQESKTVSFKPGKALKDAVN